MVRYLVAVAKGRKFGTGKTIFKNFKSLSNAKRFANNEVKKGNSIDIDKEISSGFQNVIVRKGKKK